MRRYDEPVQVRLDPRPGTPDAHEHGDGSDVPGVPAAFVWRGRLYVVREVLATWLEREAWWETAGPAHTARPYERTVWRVEAGAGRAWGTGVYDLAQAVSAPVMAGVGGLDRPGGAATGAVGTDGWWLLCHLD